jgi:hypothetical protein
MLELGWGRLWGGVGRGKALGGARSGARVSRVRTNRVESEAVVMGLVDLNSPRKVLGKAGKDASDLVDDELNGRMMCRVMGVANDVRSASQMLTGPKNGRGEAFSIPCPNSLIWTPFDRHRMVLCGFIHLLPTSLRALKIRRLDRTSCISSNINSLC